jgi:hypothetical protein
MSRNPAEESRIRTIELDDAEAGHMIAALRICQRKAGYAREYGLEGAYSYLIQKVERA